MITVCIKCGPIEVECDACAEALRAYRGDPVPDTLPWPEERRWRP